MTLRGRVIDGQPLVPPYCPGGTLAFSSSKKSRSADKAGIGSIGLGPETVECLAHLVVGASIDLDADNVSDRHHPFDTCRDICEVGAHRV